MNPRIITSFGAIFCAVCTAAVFGQAYPTKPIRVVAPFAPADPHALPPPSIAAPAPASPISPAGPVVAPPSSGSGRSPIKSEQLAGATAKAKTSDERMPFTRRVHAAIVPLGVSGTGRN